MDAGPLPAGWSGKNNALTAGVRQAKGEWLLFTDADTVHRPGSLARALAEAQAQGAALLSYSPEQEVHGFWERAVMPVIFAELAGRYRPTEVSDPASPVAAANGQYLLVSREAYDAVGGHAAIARRFARGRGAGAGGEAVGAEDFLSLWRGCGADADVSQLCAVARGLDEESGIVVSVGLETWQCCG